MTSRQKVGFNKALGEIARALNSGDGASEKLNLIVRIAARALGVKGCSLMLLDAQRKLLFHTASHGLSERYLTKGFIEAEKSLDALSQQGAVTVLDAAKDPRVQFRDPARRERIFSILSAPVRIRDEVVGSLRAYSRTEREFTSSEIEFFSTVANLAGIALESRPLSEANSTAAAAGEKKTADVALPTSRLKPVTFAHPSEEEFARLLDFYQIEWVYEPRSFMLQWEGKAGEMFTPDFYLPALDLYIEMTTLKPGLTSAKNRKVRRLRELHSGINIKLLARRDYDRLLAKYGYGRMAGAKTRGVGRVLFSAAQIEKRVAQLAKQISQDYERQSPVLIGVLRGVFCFMADLMRDLTIPVAVDFMALSRFRGESGKAVRVTKDVEIDLEGRHVLLVEDIVDTGMTLSSVLGYLRARGPASLEVCTLLDKRVRRLADVELKYVGFEVPDEFLVGYGLDYEDEYRNLPFIALMESAEAEGEPRHKKTPGDLPSLP